MKHTADTLNKLSNEARTEISEAYNELGDKLLKMTDAQIHLTKEEQKALAEMKAAFEKLDHLGAIL